MATTPRYMDKFGLEYYHNLIRKGLIEYIVGTQTATTNAWTGVSKSPSLFAGKVIIYHLPFAGNGTAATLTLTLPTGTTTGAKAVQNETAGAVTTEYAAGSDIFMVYTGSVWKCSAVGTTYAPLESPAFTGIPTAPTAAEGTRTTQIATTEFTTAAVEAEAETRQSADSGLAAEIAAEKARVDSLVLGTTTNASGWNVETITQNVAATGGSASYNFTIPADATVLEVAVRSAASTSQPWITDNVNVYTSGTEAYVQADGLTVAEVVLKITYGKQETINLPELTDIRLGADGKTYSTAGDAVRKQITDIQKELADYEEIFVGDVDESVRSWLDDHPEATTSVEDGSITDAKLSRDLHHDIDGLVTYSMARIATLPNDEFQGQYYTSDWKALQSVTYNPTDDVYLLMYSDGDGTGDCLAVLIDKDLDFIRRKIIPSTYAGHCNDVTYNPTSHQYIVATEGTGKLAVFDADTLDYVSTVTLNTVGATEQVAYDEDKEIYYVADGSSNLFSVSADFSTVERIATISLDDFPIPYDGITAQYMQGSSVYNGQFVSAWWLGGNDLSYYRLLVYSKDGTTPVHCFDYVASSLYDEAEGVTVSKDGDLLCFGYQGVNVFVCRISTSTQFVDYPYPLNIKQYNYTSSNTSIFEDIHASNPYHSYYRDFIHFEVVHPTLGGADGLLSGFSSTQNYGWQIFTSPVLTATRTYINGTWNAWVVHTLGYSVTSILSNVSASYTQIDTSDARMIFVNKDGQTMLCFKFKCSSAISSGTVTLPSSIPASATETYGSLSSADGNGGMIQYSGRTLVIRCGASSVNYLVGQIVFPAS